MVTSSVYVLALGVKGDLDLYIHPRYIFFTAGMSVVCLVLLLLNQAKHTAHSNESHSKNLLPLIVLLLFAIALPARSLTSSTISQRAVSDVSAANQTDDRALSSLFAGSSRALSLNDWARLLATNNDETYYANKTARVSGFLYDAELGGDVAWLARFVVTCCAIDAQPVGVPVHIEEWGNKYEQDTWLEVEGTFQKILTAQGEQIVLIPTSTKVIEEPENPYAN